MRSLYGLLGTVCLLLCTGSHVAGQCGRPSHLAPPPPARLHYFQVEGQTLCFDRLTGNIFCHGLCIGRRSADGEVTLVPNAEQIVSAPAKTERETVSPPSSTSSAPAAKPVQQTAAAQSQPAPVAAASQPPQQSPSETLLASSAPVRPEPLRAESSTALAAIPPEMLDGRWRAEIRDITGRTMVRELTFEKDQQLVFRAQTLGNSPLLLEGSYKLNDGQLVLSTGSEDRELGRLSVQGGKLMLRGGSESLAFTRID